MLCLLHCIGINYIKFKIINFLKHILLSSPYLGCSVELLDSPTSITARPWPRIFFFSKLDRFGSSILKIFNSMPIQVRPAQCRWYGRCVCVKKKLAYGRGRGCRFVQGLFFHFIIVGTQIPKKINVCIAVYWVSAGH